MDITDIRQKEVFEESLNGYKLVASAPPNPIEAIDFYNTELLHYNRDYPEENALIHYNLGKIYHTLILNSNDNERVKYVENAIFHLKKALVVLSYTSHPIMYAVLSTMLGQVFKERHYLINKGSLLVRKGASRAENLKMGLDQLLEIPPIYMKSEKHILEYAICCLEIGWLYLFQLEDTVDLGERIALREHIVINLERAASQLSLAQAPPLPKDRDRDDDPEGVPKEVREGKGGDGGEDFADEKIEKIYKAAVTSQWSISSPESYPPHIKVLLSGHTVTQLEGLVNYLIGRAYHYWGDEADCQMAHEYFTKCVSGTNPLLPVESIEWGDAHHRIASIIVQFPGIIDASLRKRNKKNKPQKGQKQRQNADPNGRSVNNGLGLDARSPAYSQSFGNITAVFPVTEVDYSLVGSSANRVKQADEENWDYCLQVACTHLQSAALCTKRAPMLSSLKGKTKNKEVVKAKNCDRIDGRLRVLDVYFHLAQINITRLNMLLDSLTPAEASSASGLARILSANDGRGLDILTEAESYFTEVIDRMDGVYSTALQDLYVVFYSGLKLAECRLLTSAVRQELTLDERDMSFREAVALVLNAMHSRPLNEGADLHYIATAFLSQIALSERRYHFAARTAAKALLSVCAIANRGVFTDAPRDLTYQRMIEDIWRLTSQGMVAIGRDIIWSKRHPGARTLTESITPGYAAWCFEEEEEENEEAEEQHQSALKAETETTALILPTYGAGMSVDGASVPGTPNSNKTVTKLDLTNLGRRSPAQINPSGSGDADASGRVRFGASAADRLASSRSTVIAPHKKRRRRIPSAEEMSEARRVYGSEMAYRLEKLQERSDGHYISDGSDEDVDGDGHSHAQGVATAAAAAALTAAAPQLEAVREEDEDLMTEKSLSKMGSTADMNKAVAPKRRTFSFGIFNASKIAPAVPESSSLDKRQSPQAKLKIKKKPEAKRRDSVEFRLDNKMKRQLLWSSPLCYYAAELMSRQARAQLLLRCARLQLVRGERVRNETMFLPKSLSTSLKARVADLRLLCGELPNHWVNTVRELGTTTVEDLSGMCMTPLHSRLHKFMLEFERFVQTEICEVSPYLAAVWVSGALLRDKECEEVDKPLFTADVRGVQGQIDNEEAYAKTRQRTRQLMSARGYSARGGTSSAAGTPMVGRSARTPERAATPGESENKGAENRKRSRGEAGVGSWINETVSDDRVGKASYALAQCLDGTARGSLYEFLDASLQDNECMMIWHLPTLPPSTSSSAPSASSSAPAPSFAFSAPTGGLMVVVAWRGRSLTTSTSLPISGEAADAKRRKTGKNGRRGSKDNRDDGKGIVMEIAKSDVDSVTVHKLLSSYIEALHLKPTARRATQISDVLRSLSCSLALGELFQLIPSTINSVIICCPPQLRILPWHALLIEVPPDTLPPAPPQGVNFSPLTKATAGSHNRQSVFEEPPKNHSEHSLAGSSHGNVEIPLIEKYLVRLGPTLSLFEICWESSRRLQHGATFKASAENTLLMRLPEVPLHRLCAIDGDSDETRGAGLRAAKSEIACVASVYSADPTDSSVLLGRCAAPSAVRTSRWEAESRRKAKEQRKRERRIYKERWLAAKVEKATKKRLAAAKASQRQPPGNPRRGRGRGGRDRGGGAEGETDGEPGDDGDDGNVNRKNSDAFDDEEEDEDSPRGSASSSDATDEDDRDVIVNTRYLEYCRVLHVSANKSPYDPVKCPHTGLALPEEIIIPHRYPLYDPEEYVAEGEQPRAREPMGADKKGSIPATRSDRRADRQRQMQNQVKVKDRNRRQKIPKKPLDFDSLERRSIFYATDVAKQLHLKNCGLCTLSRFGVTDDLVSLDLRQIDSTMEFIESMHLVGAGTVMFSLWGGAAQGGGLGALGQMLYLLQFYQALPLASRNTCSIGEAHRWAQLWLKNSTGSEVMKFIGEADLPPDLRDAMATEMKAYMTASARQPARGPNESAGPEPPGNPGERKYFSHPLLWGAFAVSGHGGNIHHPDLFASPAELQRAMSQRSPPKFSLPGRRSDLIKVAPPQERNYAQRPRDPAMEEKDLRLEMNALRLEGKLEEAALIEKRLRDMRRVKINSGISAVMETSSQLGSWFMNGLRKLDKALLEQDSDGSGDEGKGEGGASKKEKAGGGKEDVGDDEKGEHSNRSTPVASPKKPGGGADHRPRRLRAIDPATESGDESGGSIGMGGGGGRWRMTTPTAPRSPASPKSPQQQPRSVADGQLLKFKPLFGGRKGEVAAGGKDAESAESGDSGDEASRRHRGVVAEDPIEEGDEEGEEDDDEEEEENAEAATACRRKDQGRSRNRKKSKRRGGAERGDDDNADDEADDGEDTDDEGLQGRISKIGKQLRDESKSLGANVRSYAEAQEKLNSVVAGFRFPLRPGTAGRRPKSASADPSSEGAVLFEKENQNQGDKSAGDDNDDKNKNNSGAGEEGTSKAGCAVS